MDWVKHLELHELEHKSRNAQRKVCDIQGWMATGAAMLSIINFGLLIKALS